MYHINHCVVIFGQLLESENVRDLDMMVLEEKYIKMVRSCGIVPAAALEPCHIDGHMNYNQCRKIWLTSASKLHSCRKGDTECSGNSHEEQGGLLFPCGIGRESPVT